LGAIFFDIVLHVFSHGSWFLMQAGFPQDKSKLWEKECLMELEGFKDCEKGKGGYVQLHLVYAVKKEDI